MAVTIGRLIEADATRLKDINRLLTQLRKDSEEHKGSLGDLEQIVSDTNVVMIVASDKGHIVGTGTLYMITKVGKRSGYIEDVVVDSEYRGHGLGEKIMLALIAEAREKKIDTISLTSRPSREAANKLYQKIGFKLAETNTYRMHL